MNPEWKQCFRNGAVKRSVAGVLLLVWLNVLVLAALPNLHAHVHQDAASPTHQCAVTAIEQGNVSFQTPAPVMAEPIQTIALELTRLFSVCLPAIPYRPDLGRAPPAFFSFVV